MARLHSEVGTKYFLGQKFPEIFRPYFVVQTKSHTKFPPKFPQDFHAKNHRRDSADAQGKSLLSRREPSQITKNNSQGTNVIVIAYQSC